MILNSQLPAGENVCEVLDENGKTLCLMTPEAITAQRLPHRSCALLLWHAGKWILRRSGDGLFDFCVRGMLPGFESGEDYCRSLAGFCPTQTIMPVLLGTYLPGPESGNSVCGIYFAPVNAAFQFEDPDFLPVDGNGLKALAMRGHIAPFLAHLALTGWLERAIQALTSSRASSLS